jgi:hypothetical protein
MIARFSLIAVMGGACLAAESQIEGPKLGFVYDRKAAAVRPILGIPGAALFGDPLPSDLREAVISPSQDFAIGVLGDDSAVGLLSFSDANLRMLQGAKAAPSRIVFSPNGTSAAIVNEAHVQLFTGLPANAAAGAEFDLNDLPAALAVSDDGTITLAAIAESETMALYSYSTEGAAHRILAAGQIRSIEFLNQSHDAVFADALENKIILLRNGTDPVLLASVDQPTAVAASSDNRKIMAASSASRSITTILLDDGTSISTACGCEPVTLARLRGGDVFRITDLSDGPAWIFDTSGSEPRVLFIPQSGGGNE